MKRIVGFLLLLAAIALLASPSAAQPCPFTVVFSGYGADCTSSGFAPPTLSGSYSNGNTGCSVTFSLSAFPGCCNTYTVGRYLILGAQSVSIPFPPCTILASPDLIFVLPAANPATLAIPLPPDPALLGASAYAQGVVHRFTTIGFSHDFDFSAGLQATVQ